MNVAAATIGAGLLLAAQAGAHGNPYVVFASRFLDASGSPASGLTVRISAVPMGRESGWTLVEGVIEAGEARIAVPFAGDFAGELRLTVIDAKRRVISMLPPEGAGPRRASLTGSGTGVVFVYRHRPGEAIRSALAWEPGSANQAPGPDPDSGFLKDGEAVLGGDGRVIEGRAVAPAFRLDWVPGRIDPGEAAEAARGAELDQGIVKAFRERLAAVRRERARK